MSFPVFCFCFFLRVQFERYVCQTLKAELEPQYNFLVNWLVFAFAKEAVTRIARKSNLLWPSQKVCNP